MLRLHFLQHWFNLSDPAAEAALYDSRSMRQFVGIDLGREPMPDETTILNFRLLLERHNLGKLLFGCVNEHLASRGLKVAGGTIVDATIIAALSSIKNEAKARDPENAADAEGSAMVFRDVATHRGGQQDQADPLDRDHRGERA
jgi:IS5 family transposase